MVKKHISNKAGCWNALVLLLANKRAQFKQEHWSELLAYIDWHHISPDVASVLVQELEEPSPFSDQQLEEIRVRSMRARLDNLKKLQTQKQLSLCLQKTNVRHLFFKGIVLGAWLYDKYDKRECGDIDLIVHPEEHSIAVGVLLKNGFKQLIPKPSLSASAMRRYKSAMKDMTFIDPRTEVLVELHWRLRESDSYFQFNFDQEYKQHRVVSIDGNNFPSFNDHTHVRYLAMHGCLSYWGRLRWLIDWHQLSGQPFDWLEIYQTAANRKESNYLDLAFLTANQVLSTPIPEVLNMTETSITGFSINKTGWKHFWVRKVLKGMQLNSYRNWLLRKGLNHIAFEDYRKSCGSFCALVRKSVAVDTL